MSEGVELRLVLHAMRLLGTASSERVAERYADLTGLADPAPADRDADSVVDRVQHLLISAERSGWVSHRSGYFAGWSLTSEGRSHAELLLRAEIEESDTLLDVDAAYRRFVTINRSFLEVCTDWQVLGAGTGTARVNDHSDAEHDLAVLERLEVHHRQVVAITVDLSGSLGRFGSYRHRFE
ncbi:MAG TPA: hypothetical protein PLP95_11880, partial [Microthrixaceae bacterium]|nr:hypothetical protein [Microthrixaceae bacterium]